MQRHLLNLVESLDEARKDVFGRVNSLDESQRTASSGDGQWSPVAIVEHLVRAEQSIFADMLEPDRCMPASPTLANRLNRLGIVCILKFRIPVPVPADAMIPQGETNLEELAARWGDHMAWLRRFIDNASPATLEHACFSHPVAGPLTLAQALKLATLHVGYHLPTLDKRIRTARTG